MHLKLHNQFLSHYLRVFGLAVIAALLIMANITTAQTNISPTVYFEAPQAPITQGSLFAVKIFINTVKPINALAVNVSYSQDILKLRSISTADSFINFWHGVSPTSDNGTIYFEGGTTVPFSGSKGKIGELVFESLKQDTAHVTFTKTDVYYADGAGTSIIAEGAQADVLISSEGTAVAPPLSFQTAPPPIINAGIVDNPIGGYPLATFTVTDKGTGIQSSQIRFLKYFLWGEWKNVSNFVPIPSNALAFQVKVTDSNGNVVEKTVYVWKSFFVAVFLLIIAVVIGIFSFRAYRLWRRRGMVL